VVFEGGVPCPGEGEVTRRGTGTRLGTGSQRIQALYSMTSPDSTPY
jgi:hypothetical protein